MPTRHFLEDYEDLLIDFCSDISKKVMTNEFSQNISPIVIRHSDRRASLQKKKSLRFFPLTYAKKNNFKSTRPNFNHEGPCFIYIQELEKHNAFTSPFVSVS